MKPGRFFGDVGFEWRDDVVRGQLVAKWLIVGSQCGVLVVIA